jgi:hypothetical protein
VELGLSLKVESFLPQTFVSFFIPPAILDKRRWFSSYSYHILRLRLSLRLRSLADMAAGDSIPALLAFTLVEAYFLQRTVFADQPFRTVVLGAVAFNVFLKSLYSLVIWPFFLNPLRHLPMVPVRTTRQP